MNLEGRLPLSSSGKDAAYVMKIWRCQLDGMGGRAEQTITGHANSIKRTIAMCDLIGKTPSIPPRGPFPMKDQIGMGVGVEMNLKGLTARGRPACSI